MTGVTYHVVVYLDRDDEGDLKPGDAREVSSAGKAMRKRRSADMLAAWRSPEPASRRPAISKARRCSARSGSV